MVRAVGRILSLSLLSVTAAACSPAADQALPYLIAGLPRRDAAAVHFAARVRARYPVGTAEAMLVSDLQRQGFTVPAGGRAPRQADYFTGDGTPCRALWSVRWQVRDGRVSDIGVVTGLQCL